MRYTLTLLLLFSVISSFSQSPGFVQYKDTVNSFSINIPTGWRYGTNKNSPDLKLVAIRTATDSSDKPYENFNLNILVRKNSSLEREYEKLINALTSTGDFNLIKKDTATMNGQHYKWFMETHKNPANSISVTNYVFMTYKNEKTYILTFVAYSGDFAKYETLFTAIAGSLIL